MTGYDIYESAMMLLGYVRADGSLSEDEGIKQRAVFAVNSISADIGLKTVVKNLTEELCADSRHFEVLTYGVGMLLSLSEEDREKNEIFTRIYNAKRASLKSSNGKIKDALPRIGEV